MVNLSKWNLDYPLSQEDFPEDTIVVSRRGTSGAGQFELAYSSHDVKGNLVTAKKIEGKQITFRLLDLPECFHNPNGISISERYPVREVGDKTRITIHDQNRDRPNISALFECLLFLPEGSSKNSSLEPVSNELRLKTFWIDAIAARISKITETSIEFFPVQIFLATGNRASNCQFKGARRLDFNSRLKDLFLSFEILALKAHDELKVAANYFLDVFKGKQKFDFDAAKVMKDAAINYLATKHCEEYVYGNDPLPILMHLSTNYSAAGRERFMNHNLIYFGAPGTGKSYQLAKDSKVFSEKNIRRVTFYPDYTYSQFVGSFKPYSSFIEPDEDEPHCKIETKIEYKFVPGPFMEIYLKAWQNPDDNFLLIIEEINRSNSAAVFGDLFQLLDRADDDTSEYPIATPYEMRDWLRVRLPEFANRMVINPNTGQTQSDLLKEQADCLKLPANLYIWATMNSADQGVFPMDTAFKRRWDFKYIGVDAYESVIKDIRVKIPDTNHEISWNGLRRGINEVLRREGINEDKLLGPFFINPRDLKDSGRFGSVFKDKVLLYLYEDAGKIKKDSVFSLGKNPTYSAVCSKYDSDGVGVFKDFPKNCIEADAVNVATSGQESAS